VKRRRTENWPYFNWIPNRFQQILKIICWIYLNIIFLISQISVDSGQGVKNLKNHSKQPCFDRIQEQDINRISSGYQGLLYTGYRVVTPWNVTYLLRANVFEWTSTWLSWKLSWNVSLRDYFFLRVFVVKSHWDYQHDKADCPLRPRMLAALSRNGSGEQLGSTDVSLKRI